jgi:hypothetical protein
MGAWGTEPWDNDGAADWLGDLFGELNVPAIADALELDDDHETVRAACYVLQSLGRVYVWPAAHLKDLKPLLKKGIERLERMIDPSSTDDFLELWDSDPDVIKSVQWQIAELRNRSEKVAD